MGIGTPSYLALSCLLCRTVSRHPCSMLARAASHFHFSQSFSFIPSPTPRPQTDRPQPRAPVPGRLVSPRLCQVPVPARRAGRPSHLSRPSSCHPVAMAPTPSSVVLSCSCSRQLLPRNWPRPTGRSPPPPPFLKNLRRFGLTNFAFTHGGLLFRSAAAAGHTFPPYFQCVDRQFSLLVSKFRQYCRAGVCRLPQHSQADSSASAQQFFVQSKRLNPNGAKIP